MLDAAMLTRISECQPAAAITDDTKECHFDALPLQLPLHIMRCTYYEMYKTIMGEDRFAVCDAEFTDLPDLVPLVPVSGWSEECEDYEIEEVD